MTDAMTKERETKMEISPLHGQAIHQSYYSRIKEAFQAFKPLVPSLLSSVKELYSCLTKLAHSASFHAAKLHKAVEGVEGSLESRSQDSNLSSGDLISSYPQYDDLDGDNMGEPVEVKDESLVGVHLLSAEDKGWISPPDSIYSSSSGGGSISGETYSSSGFGLKEAVENLTIYPSNKEDDHKEQHPFTETDQHDTLRAGMSNEMESKYDDTDLSLNLQPNASRDGVCLPKNLSADALSCMLKEEKLDMNLGVNEATSLKRVGAGDDSQNDLLKKDGVRAIRGKNAFAISVLRRVEMKLDGRDLSDNRELSIGEQVEYLLKQATSADNLCNMYEGWTAWILVCKYDAQMKVYVVLLWYIHTSTSGYSLCPCSPLR